MILGGTEGANEKRSADVFLQSCSDLRSGTRTHRLTKDIQADFLGLLARLVPADAGVVSFVHLLHVRNGQFGAVHVQAVLVSRLQHDAVAATEEGDAASDSNLTQLQQLRADGGEDAAVCHQASEVLRGAYVRSSLPPIDPAAHRAPDPTTTAGQRQ